MRIFQLIFFLFFTTAYSIAQQLPDAYVKAKSDLEAGEYLLAKAGFDLFLDEEAFGTLSYFAAFHSAEAAIQLGLAPQAIESLMWLKGKNWEKVEEVNYLLALAYFHNKEFVPALKTLKELTQEPFLSKGYRTTFAFLQSSDPNLLTTLSLQEFLNNKGLSAALIYALQKKAILSSSDRNLLNQLSLSVDASIAKNKVLDVVLILPFTTSSEENVFALEDTNFLFEMYQGIVLEIARLKSEGFAIQLHTFDSKRDLSYLNTLTKDPVLLAADVIVGPIYPDESELISEFAESNQIPFIHPLSNLGGRFEGNQFSYLFRPSLNSLADGVSAALTSQNWGKTVAIGYSGNSRDEQLGMLLKDQLEKDGFDVITNQQVNPKSVNLFLQNLGIRNGNLASVNQVILLGDDPAIARSVFSLIESISIELPILVMDSWLSFNFSNYEMLEFGNFHFIANNTPKFHAEEMNTVREVFYQNHLKFPSSHALLGAELIHWIHLNAKYDTNFSLRSSLDLQGYQSGRLSWGFNFQNVNNNSYSPVFKLESGELIPLH